MVKRELLGIMDTAGSGFRGRLGASIQRLVVTLLVYTIATTAAASGIADDLHPLNTRKIESEVWNLGRDKHVAVRLTSGQTVHGFITAIGPNSFALSPYDGKPRRVIPYSRVASVKTKRSLLPWIMAGVIVGMVILIAIVHAPTTQLHGR